MYVAKKRSHGIFPHSHGLHMDPSAVGDLRLSYHSEYHFSIRTCSLSRFSPWSEEGPKRLAMMGPDIDG